MSRTSPRTSPRILRRTAAVTLAAALLTPIGGLDPTARAQAAAAPVFDEQEIFAKGQGGYGCFRIPAIVAAADGALLAFAEGRVAGCGDDGDIDIVLRRSTDGGRSWGPIRLVLHGAGDTRGNPVPVLDTSTGRLTLLSTHNPGADDTKRTPWVQHSTDNGRTWSAAKDLSSALQRPEWDSWYATGPGHGIQLTRGPHAGRLVAGGNHEGDTGTLRGAHLMYSDDGGTTWRLGAQDTRTDNTVKPQELSLTERTDGGVYAAARDQHGDDPGNRAAAVSTDQGDTFDRPFATIPGLDAPVVQGATVRYSATGTGGSRDRILFSAPAHPAVRETMAIRSSFDEGATWETWQQGRVVHWGPAAYSDLVRLPGDEAALLYEGGTVTANDGIRFARFNEAWLDEPNGTPPGLPDPPAPGPASEDTSPYDNDAYVRGGATTTPGRYGNALNLDGADDRAEVPWDDSLDMAASPFTWTVWFRYTNDGAWHFAALQRDAGRFTLSVDGAKVADAAAPGGAVSGEQRLGLPLDTITTP